MTSIPVWMPPVIAQRRLDASGERRRAAKAKRQVRGIRQRQRPDDLELFDVDVGPVKAREEDEPIGAGRVELTGEVRKGGEERRHLDGHRHLDGALHLAQGVDGLPFDIRGAHGHVAGGVKQVQLEAVRAGVFEQLRVGDPAARRDAVERARSPECRPRCLTRRRCSRYSSGPSDCFGFRLERAGFAEGIACGRRG